MEITSGLVVKCRLELKPRFGWSNVRLGVVVWGDEVELKACPLLLHCFSSMPFLDEQLSC